VYFEQFLPAIVNPELPLQRPIWRVRSHETARVFGRAAQDLHHRQIGWCKDFRHGSGGNDMC
jgi:hypothetical protein